MFIQRLACENYLNLSTVCLWWWAIIKASVKLNTWQPFIIQVHPASYTYVLTWKLHSWLLVWGEYTLKGNPFYPLPPGTVTRFSHSGPQRAAPFQQMARSNKKTKQTWLWRIQTPTLLPTFSKGRGGERYNEDRQTIGGGGDMSQKPHIPSNKPLTSKHLWIHELFYAVILERTVEIKI